MGNCLDKNYSSSEESDEQQIVSSDTDRHRSRLTSSSSNNRYTNLIEEASSSTASLNPSSRRSISVREHNRLNSRSSNNPSLNNYLSQSYGGYNTNGSLAHGFSSSLPSSGLDTPYSQQQQQQQQQVFYLTPNTQRTADQLTEEEQIKLLKRMTLIQQLPTGSFDENKKHKECVICMIDFEKNDTIKYLPCMHTFHQSCIDTWLLRSLICPSCMEPVDAGLLAAYE